MSAYQPLVKVVITSFNRRELLRQAVESVLAQTYHNIHVVIVDDVSSDGSHAVARDFEYAHPGRVTAVLKQRNGGLSHTIKIGIDSAPKADFIAILNDDDHWLPQKLERQLERFRMDPKLGLVFAEAQICDEHSRLTGELFSDVAGRFTKFDLDEALRSNHSCASTHLMTSELAEVVARTMPLHSCLADYYTVLVAAGLSSFSTVDTPLAVYMHAPSGMHAHAALNSRDTTVSRECLFEEHPQLAAELGGYAAMRRRLGWLAFDLALYALRDGDLRTWAWQASHVLKQRSAKPLVWLCLHSLRMLPTALLRPRRASA